MIKEIAFIFYPVKNFERARKFYEELLDLKPEYKSDNGKLKYVEYDVGGTTFTIGVGTTLFKSSKEGPCVAFEVNDFDSMIKRLKDNNVKFINEPRETPICWNVMIADPDGSKIMIHKRKSIKS